MKLISFLILSCFIFGCQTENNIHENVKTNDFKFTKIALICNLTKVNPDYYDGWDGECPGTDVDAKNFASFCAKNDISYIKLENEQCTNKKVMETWIDCVNSLNPTNGLFIFFYSGHGGQVYTSDSNEVDGMDETLCFWDGQMRDNTVWQLLNYVHKKCRIFMVTDCCNSGTNYQLPFNPSLKKKFTRSIQPNMIHYGGCNDGEYSYGSVFGGTFTCTLKKFYNKNLTYKQWFDSCYEHLKNSHQKPTFAETGISFKDLKIFE